MNENEKTFMVQLAMGWFSVDGEGRVWRHGKRAGGGTLVMNMFKEPRRAERSVSRRHGYLRVMFATENGRRVVAAHRIVWMVHNRRDIPEGLEINHEDGDKQNNRPPNLSVVTRSQNTQHWVDCLGGLEKRRMQRRRIGKKGHPRAALTGEEVIEIRRLWKTRAVKQQELADAFGVAQPTIANIIARNSWKHIP